MRNHYQQSRGGSQNKINLRSRYSYPFIQCYYYSKLSNRISVLRTLLEFFFINLRIRDIRIIYAKKLQEINDKVKY
mgnify:CR=1 FL=1